MVTLFIIITNKQFKFVEFQIDIDPSSLVPRIMSVREQIAREFVIDTDLIRIVNDQSE